MSHKYILGALGTLVTLAACSDKSAPPPHIEAIAVSIDANNNCSLETRPVECSQVAATIKSHYPTSTPRVDICLDKDTRYAVRRAEREGVTVTTVTDVSDTDAIDGLHELVVHRRGALLMLDAIQGLGVFPLDVQASGIDFLAADGHKWMLGPEGAGIFFVRQEHLERLRPIGVGCLTCSIRRGVISAPWFRKCSLRRIVHFRSS